MAGGRPGHSRKTGEGLVTVVASVFGAQCCAIELDFGADSANPASIGIDDTAAYGDTGRQSKLIGCFLAERTALFTSASVYAILVRQQPTLDEAFRGLTSPFTPPKRLKSSFTRSPKPISSKKSPCQPLTLPSTPTGT